MRSSPDTIRAIVLSMLFVLTWGANASIAADAADQPAPARDSLGLPPPPGDPGAAPSGTPGSHDLTGLQSERLMPTALRNGDLTATAGKSTTQPAVADVATASRTTDAAGGFLGLSTTELALAGVAIVGMLAAALFAFRRRT